MSSKYAEHFAKWVEIGVGGRKPGNFKRGNISISKKALDSLGESPRMQFPQQPQTNNAFKVQMYSDKQEFFSCALQCIQTR